MWNFLNNHSVFSVYLLQGKPGLVCLIPELCYITGLTDAVRQDFRVMKVSVTVLELGSLSKDKVDDSENII